jgi:hypothetical protein
MNFLKDLLKLFVDDGMKKSLAEDELMKALNDRIDYSKVPKDDLEASLKSTKCVSVPGVGVWSSFKYVGLPPIRGIEALKADNRVYFTIPCGWELDPSPKFWYMCFPLDGTPEEVVEFFTTYDILKTTVQE